MTRVPEYTKRAINKYNSKWDRIAVNLPKGTKDRIKEVTRLSCNAYISALVLSDLERRQEIEQMEKQEKSLDSAPFPEVE